jgi:hypothetical protein
MFLEVRSLLDYMCLSPLVGQMLEEVLFLSRPIGLSKFIIFSH